MKYVTLFTLLTMAVFALNSCKKDWQPSLQYYGEPILESKEFFPDQELFDFGSFPAVSPDGRYLAYRVPSTISIERNGIWLIDLQNGEKRLFQKNATFPSWSPDSKKLCYSLNGIYIKNITGDSSKILTSEGGFESKWHPRGDTISYIHSTKGLHFINLLSNDIIRILDYEGGGNHNWNIDGKTILGWKSAAPRSSITQWNITNKKLLEINPLANAYVTQPVYSPNGQKIAFQAANGLYIINTDGTNLQQVLYNEVRRKPGLPYKPGDKGVNDLSWHPDGKHLVYQVIEFTRSSIGFGSQIFGEGYSTIYKLNIEKALQINKP
ncbi:translocation protein TolB [Pedobacter glucosidilyticus]|nr:PD40 domain-containing protein [Pedobacter glucosidilyticus]KHJ39508.1 translocation protein TolB [Pedobacter glucosidilyticus]